jgi:hypothetical protein
MDALCIILSNLFILDFTHNFVHTFIHIYMHNTESVEPRVLTSKARVWSKAPLHEASDQSHDDRSCTCKG